MEVREIKETTHKNTYIDCSSVLSHILCWESKKGPLSLAKSYGNTYPELLSTLSKTNRNSGSRRLSSQS